MRRRTLPCVVIAAGVPVRRPNIRNSVNRGRKTGYEIEKVRIRTIISHGIAALHCGLPHAPARSVLKNAVRKGDLVETECRIE
jgi:hypothetical protein